MIRGIVRGAPQTLTGVGEILHESLKTFSFLGLSHRCAEDLNQVWQSVAQDNALFAIICFGGRDTGFQTLLRPKRGWNVISRTMGFSDKYRPKPMATVGKPLQGWEGMVHGSDIFSNPWIGD